MANGTQCIGRITGGDGEWFAELDFEEASAAIMERTKSGRVGPVAHVPFGAFFEEDEDYAAELHPTDEQNKRLMLVVFAPEMRAKLAGILDDCNKVNVSGDPAVVADRLIDLLDSIKTECEDTLGMLEPPPLDNPKNREDA